MKDSTNMLKNGFAFELPSVNLHQSNDGVLNIGRKFSSVFMKNSALTYKVLMGFEDWKNELKFQSNSHQNFV